MSSKSLGEYMWCDSKEKNKLTFFQGTLKKYERGRATYFEISTFIGQNLMRWVEIDSEDNRLIDYFTQCSVNGRNPVFNM